MPGVLSARWSGPAKDNHGEQRAAARPAGGRTGRAARRVVRRGGRVRAGPDADDEIVIGEMRGSVIRELRGDRRFRVRPRCSWPRATTGPRPSCRSRRRTRSATGARRCARSRPSSPRRWEPDMLFAGPDRDGVAEGQDHRGVPALGRAAGRRGPDLPHQRRPDRDRQRPAGQPGADLRLRRRHLRRRPPATPATSAAASAANDAWPTFLIKFHLVEGPDPREELAATADLTPSRPRRPPRPPRQTRRAQPPRRLDHRHPPPDPVQARHPSRRPRRRVQPRHRRLQTRRPQTKKPRPHLQPRSRLRT